MKQSPRLLAAVLFAVAAVFYLITLFVRENITSIALDGAVFLTSVTVLPAAVAGFFLGKRLQRDAASVASTKTRAVRGLFAGAILTALAYVLGITGFVVVGLVLNGSLTSADLMNAFEGLMEILGGGIVEVLIGIPFGAVAGMAFYLLTGKQGDPGMDGDDTVS